MQRCPFKCLLKTLSQQQEVRVCACCLPVRMCDSKTRHSLLLQKKLLSDLRICIVFRLVPSYKRSTRSNDYYWFYRNTNLISVYVHLSSIKI